MNINKSVKKKIIVTEVSSPQPDFEKIKFASHIKDVFKPYFVVSGVYYKNRRGLKYQTYNVLRLPEKNEMEIKEHAELLESDARQQLESCIAQTLEKL